MSDQVVFRTQRRVEFADTDMAGIVHFANFFRFMESAEVEFLRSRGLSVAMTWEGQKVGFPRVSATCDYLKPACFEDLLDVSVSLIRLGAKSATYGFTFLRAGEVLARGQVTSVCCSFCSGQPPRSMPIPDSIRASITSPAG